MIEKLPESEGSALGVRITGKVSLEMEKEWISNFEKVIEEHGKKVKETSKEDGEKINEEETSKKSGKEETSKKSGEEEANKESEEESS